jgi:hypothetical protein
MPEKITWEWLADRLDGLNAAWIEREANLRVGRLRDVKRGKSSLSEAELVAIREALLRLSPRS